MTTPHTAGEAAYEIAFRLGVPTFILVLGMFMLLPRLDTGLATAQRVEVYLDVLAQQCVAGPLPR